MPERFRLSIHGRLSPADGEALRSAGFTLEGSSEFKVGVGGGDEPVVRWLAEGEDTDEVVERARTALGRDDSGGMSAEAAD